MTKHMCTCGHVRAAHMGVYCWTRIGQGTYCECDVYVTEYLAGRRDELAEAKAEFDRQADELQENLEKLSRHLSRREP